MKIPYSDREAAVKSEMGLDKKHVLRPWPPQGHSLVALIFAEKKKPATSLSIDR